MQVNASSSASSTANLLVKGKGLTCRVLRVVEDGNDQEPAGLGFIDSPGREDGEEELGVKAKTGKNPAVKEATCPAFFSVSSLLGGLADDLHTEEK